MLIWKAIVLRERHRLPKSANEEKRKTGQERHTPQRKSERNPPENAGQKRKGTLVRGDHGNHLRWQHGLAIKKVKGGGPIPPKPVRERLCPDLSA